MFEFFIMMMLWDYDCFQSFSHEALSSREMRNWNLCYLLTRDKRKSMVVKDPQKSKILDEILHLFQIHVIPIMNVSKFFFPFFNDCSV